MANGKKFTYAELSKETGISIATISRVMNRSHLVTSETRRKVLSALSACGVDISELEFEEENEKLIVFNVPSLRNIFYSPVISSARIRIEEKGYTLVVTRLYFKDALVKAEVALAKGKEGQDKRRQIKEREEKRNIQRIIKEMNYR